jgi:hypothetical protein
MHVRANATLHGQHGLANKGTQFVVDTAHTPHLTTNPNIFHFQMQIKVIQKLAVFWVAAVSIFIALMMETASTSETSVNFYQTTRRNKSPSVV